MRRGLASSRHQAAELIAQGIVSVGGAIADKPARLVADSENVVVLGPSARFVSRGGEKLDAALERFGVPAQGRRCLDAGASTGGFTDCLLARGATEVVAVDVGHGIMDARLRDDPRVTLLERTNVRGLGLDDVGGMPFEVVVADLSFISLTVVCGVLAGALAVPGADLVLLVKPQFEAGRKVVSRGRGVVRDPAERSGALERVASALLRAGATIMDAMASPLLGPSGNAEFFVYAKAHTSSSGGPRRNETDTHPASVLQRIIDAAVSAAPDSSSGSSRPAPDRPRGLSHGEALGTVHDLSERARRTGRPSGEHPCKQPGEVAARDLQR